MTQEVSVRKSERHGCRKRRTSETDAEGREAEPLGSVRRPASPALESRVPGSRDSHMTEAQVT